MAKNSAPRMVKTAQMAKACAEVGLIAEVGNGTKGARAMLPSSTIDANNASLMKWVGTFDEVSLLTCIHAVKSKHRQCAGACRDCLMGFSDEKVKGKVVVGDLAAGGASMLITVVDATTAKVYRRRFREDADLGTPATDGEAVYSFTYKRCWLTHEKFRNTKFREGSALFDVGKCEYVYVGATMYGHFKTREPIIKFQWKMSPVIMSYAVSENFVYSFGLHETVFVGDMDKIYKVCEDGDGSHAYSIDDPIEMAIYSSDKKNIHGKHHKKWSQYVRHVKMTKKKTFYE